MIKKVDCTKGLVGESEKGLTIISFRECDANSYARD